jgi:hypothetical protein
MAPPRGPRQVDSNLDNFNYLHMIGRDDPIEYIPVDDFFDQVRSGCRGP